MNAPPICTMCRHCERINAGYVCNRRPYKFSVVDGSATTQRTLCLWERRGGIVAWLPGLCGPSGRYFEAKQR